VAFQFDQKPLDTIDRQEDQRNRLATDRRAVAKLSHQGLGGVCERFKTRQSEKSAGTLDGVDQPEHVAENCGVIGLPLEAHEFDIDEIETLAGLGQEFTQQVVHRNRSCQRGPGRRAGTARMTPICRRGV
jgi:hypothetical protein